MAKRTQTFTNGQVIYRVGANSDRAYEVLSGAVELLGDGDARVGIARAGDMFGEGGLIGGGTREATARAVGSVVLRAILRVAVPSSGRQGASSPKPHTRTYPWQQR